MTQKLWQEFLPLMGSGVLATVNDDGSPHQVLAPVFYDGDYYYVRTTENTRELDNLRRNPQLSLSTQSPRRPWGKVVIRAHAMELRVERSTGCVYIRIGADSVEDADA